MHWIMSNYELIDHKVRFDPYRYVQIDTEQLEQQVASARFTEVVPMQKKILTAIKISKIKALNVKKRLHYTYEGF